MTFRPSDLLSNSQTVQARIALQQSLKAMMDQQAKESFSRIKVSRKLLDRPVFKLR